MEGSAAAGAAVALRRGLDLGLTHIDTAEMYGSGTSEKIVGQAIEGRRDEVFWFPKSCPGNAFEHGIGGACEKRARLRTDGWTATCLIGRGAFSAGTMRHSKHCRAGLWKPKKPRRACPRWLGRQFSPTSPIRTFRGVDVRQAEIESASQRHGGAGRGRSLHFPCSLPTQRRVAESRE